MSYLSRLSFDAARFLRHTLSTAVAPPVVKLISPSYPFSYVYANAPMLLTLFHVVVDMEYLGSPLGPHIYPVVMRHRHSPGRANDIPGCSLENWSGTTILEPVVVVFSPTCVIEHVLSCSPTYASLPTPGRSKCSPLIPDTRYLANHGNDQQPCRANRR